MGLFKFRSFGQFRGHPYRSNPPAPLTPPPISSHPTPTPPHSTPPHLIPSHPPVHIISPQSTQPNSPTPIHPISPHFTPLHPISSHSAPPHSKTKSRLHKVHTHYNKTSGCGVRLHPIFFVRPSRREGVLQPYSDQQHKPRPRLGDSGEPHTSVKPTRAVHLGYTAYRRDSAFF